VRYYLVLLPNFQADNEHIHIPLLYTCAAGLQELVWCGKQNHDYLGRTERRLKSRRRPELAAPQRGFAIVAECRETKIWWSASMWRALNSSSQERRDESRRGRHECPRHENQVVAGTYRLRDFRRRTLTGSRQLLVTDGRFEG
jgi:hypothetical protein